MAVEIKELFGRKELKPFVNFQFELYKDNPYWCPPLKKDEFDTLDKDKNPAFEYCKARYWIAIRNNKTVGRIAAIINSKSNEKWNEKHIRFGWFDFIDDIEVSTALIQQVTLWASQEGLNAIHGPLGFTDMDNEGMLVYGFDEMSTMSSIYNYEYYLTHMDKLGFVKDADWVQNIITIPDSVPEKLEKFAELIAKKYELRVFVAKKAKDLLPYAMDMFRALNTAFDELYGFVALNEKQMQMYVKQYFGFIQPQYVCFVIDKEDKVVGFGINLPSLTKAMQKCKGSLWPFGFIHVLKAMKNNDTIDLYLNGVLPEYQGKGVHTLYYSTLTKAFIKGGFKYAITSSQLEENAKALNVWKQFDARQHMVRRAYIKKLI